VGWAVSAVEALDGVDEFELWWAADGVEVGIMRTP
jgi:hypothetical protein